MLNIEKAVQLLWSMFLSGGVSLCVSERHFSVVYVEDVKLEDAEVTKICKASYQLVDLRTKALLTDNNWQACCMHT